MTDLAAQRRFYAEEVQIASNIRSARIVEALARVPRERFLPPGPWTIRSDGDFGAPPRQTPDADPRHVYHNIAVAIDPGRMLFNGMPGLICTAMDALGVEAGRRALHLGAGTGYFTALMGHAVSPAGRVVAIEADEALAAQAKANLAPMPWIDVRHGDGSAALDESFDAILVNAGVTHPLDVWLDAVSPAGRMVIPLTAAMAPMGNIGKGLMLLVTKTADADAFDVRVLTFVAIFSAIGVRDEALNAEIGKALAKHPFPPLKRLRRGPHERSESCWLHGASFCLAI
ncbi:MAG TPA: methyltransferase domain-containing protein [Vicinamibacterales bacterium]|jgi:protein-L-isoaspartate(D-aspartate) O-methyltransferase|nr:methyltransferase domain-containing protein [Vicinamibacterales bacterium]